MKEQIRGRAYVLGHDVDTDQIIPAHHLVYSLNDPDERKQYGRYALSGIPEAQAGLPQGHVSFVRDGDWRTPYTILVAGRNFGCGSSREHAPVALQIAGIEAVVAESYARIFYRNVVDGGFLIPLECESGFVQEIRTGDELEIEVIACRLTNLTQGTASPLKPLGAVLEILRAGDVFAYARAQGLLTAGGPGGEG